MFGFTIISKAKIAKKKARQELVEAAYMRQFKDRPDIQNLIQCLLWDLGGIDPDNLCVMSAAHQVARATEAAVLESVGS